MPSGETGRGLKLKWGCVTLERDQLISILNFVWIYIDSRKSNEKLNLFSSRCFDKNGIGTISRQDLHAVFENLGEKLVDDEIEGLLDEADLEGEGVIAYSDFCAFKNLV